VATQSSRVRNGDLKIVAVIQARVGSTRLPGKVLLPLGGRPVLERMLARVARAEQLDDVVVATTRLAADDSIRRLTAACRVPCISGDPYDLVDRHLLAARATGADAVVKIPSDCPLIDPAIIDETVGFFRANADRYAYVSNLHPATWPDGNDVEVIRLDALETTAREARRPFEREHTTPFIWDQPDRFALGNVAWSTGQDLSSAIRLTLDYEEDFQLISAVFEALHRADSAGAAGALVPPFTVEAIVAFLESHPEVRALNAAYSGRSWMQDHAAELRTLGGHAAGPPAGGAALEAP
jgi:spore coat polysaccharide biosynthesis protein SpsF